MAFVVASENTREGSSSDRGESVENHKGEYTKTNRGVLMTTILL